MTIYRLQPGLRRRRKPATSSSGGFPLSLPDLSLWLQGKDLSSFTFGTGSAVAAWNDKSGNGRHVTQATSANQPARSGTLNGNPTVVFDGTNDNLRRSNAPLNNASGGAFSVFAVVVPAGLSGDRSIVDADDTSGERIAQYLRTSGTSAQCITFNESSVNTSASGGSLSTSTAYLLDIICTGPAATLSVNGTSVDTLSQSDQKYRASATLSIGAHSSGSQYWNGAIAEVIACATNLTGSALTDTRAYLQSEHGL